MSLSNVCRLCFSETNGLHMDLFSEIGVEIRMSEIVSEHFKCNVSEREIKFEEHEFPVHFTKIVILFVFIQVSESDSLPNIICQACWSTTEAFHELYLRSRQAQSRFLNSSVKSRSYMPDTTGFNHGHATFIPHSYGTHSYEPHSYEKQPIDVCTIQMETNVADHIDSHLKATNFV